VLCARKIPPLLGFSYAVGKSYPFYSAFQALKTRLFLWEPRSARLSQKQLWLIQAQSAVFFGVPVPCRHGHERWVQEQEVPKI